jgi:hypothetical protein
MVGSALYLVAWLNPRSRLKQTYKQSGAASGETLEFSETGILLHGPGWRAEFAWNAVSSFSENHRILLLVLAQSRSVIIPKRVCTSDQLQELQNLLAEKVAPKKSPPAIGS